MLNTVNSPTVISPRTASGTPAQMISTKPMPIRNCISGRINASILHQTQIPLGVLPVQIR